MQKRLIEVEGAFPLEEVSSESRREKNIRHGHISTLHIWWARRPLAASRATIFAALMPAPENSQNQSQSGKNSKLRNLSMDALKDLIAKIGPWEAVKDGDSHYIQQARSLIRKIYPKPPKVLDCFAGGGSIPLEALRLGCETYALEYNPVAVLILKAVLEYPQKFGRDLLGAVRRWGEWVLNEAKRELDKFYPRDPDGSIPVGYIWARTLPCQDPNCGAEIPLMRQTWLAKRDNRKIALKLIADKAAKRVNAVIVQGNQIDFDPSVGTVKGAVVTCPVCGGTIDADTTRQLFREGKSSQRMMAVVLHHPIYSGKIYRLPTKRDLQAYHAAEKALEDKRQKLWNEWGIDPVPGEPLLFKSAQQLPKYGMPKYGDLFNSRQKLALITFADAVRRAHKEMLAQGADPEFAKAVTMYLALVVDMMAVSCNTLCRWENTRELIADVFSRQALPMLWDFAELNPFSGGSGSWVKVFGYVSGVLTHLTRIPPVEEGNPPAVHHGSATALPWPDDFFDAVLTDPPYYDNVNYSALSDFFYVWLKRTIGDLYPDLFATPLTPKTEEIVQDPNRQGGREQAKAFFERMLTQAFREIARVLKPEGIAVIVFAHTSVDAWESVIKALLDADLYLTASLPIYTEMKERLTAQESAALASSVYMVCRKRAEQKVGEYRKVVSEMQEAIPKSLKRFWDAGISGADFWQSSIGPAVAIFGRYKKVLKQDGTEISVRELLEETRKIVAQYALRRVLEKVGGDAYTVGGIDPMTRFYLVWRWTFGGGKIRVPFDAALRVARAEGVDLHNIAKGDGLVKIKGNKVWVVGPSERKSNKRFMQSEQFSTLIDALHRAVIAWQSGDEGMLQLLLGQHGGNNLFWQVAQAIAEVLPEGDEERRLLHGFLATRSRKVRGEEQQPRLL